MYSLFPAKNPEKYLRSRQNPQMRFSEILSEGNQFYIPRINFPKQNNIFISRFLAKVALEALAHRIRINIEFIAEVGKNVGLDPIRNYARYGKGKFWPYHYRIIYDQNKLFSDDVTSKFQILHEYNIVSFKPNEYYLMLVFFGHEFAINLGSRDLSSFSEWLKTNEDKSPLDYDQFPAQYSV